MGLEADHSAVIVDRKHPFDLVNYLYFL